MSTFESIITFLTGIGVFLYGCKLISKNVDSVAGAKLRNLIKKFSSNALTGILFGTFLAFVLQSGTASVGMVIGLAVVDIITTVQAIYIIIGINIGTSLAIVLLGFTGSGFSLTTLFMIFAVIGVFVLMFVKSNKMKAISNILVGFGVLFVGVTMIGNGTKFISTSESIINILKSIDNIGIGSLFGAILTMVTQSTMSLIKIMAGMSNALDISQCGYILFASNVGSAVATMLFVGVTSNRKGFRISLSYLVLKICGYMVFSIFTILVPWITTMNNAFENSVIGMFSENSYLWTLICINLIYSVGTGVIFGLLNKIIIKLVYFIVPVTEEMKEASVTTESTGTAIVQIGVKIQNIYLDYATILNRATKFIASKEKNEKPDSLINELKEIHNKVTELEKSLFSLGEIANDDELHLKTCLTNTITGTKKGITNTINLLNSTLIGEDKRVTYTQKQQPYIKYLTERVLLISDILSKIINTSRNGEEMEDMKGLMESILNSLDECVEKKVEAKKYIITAEHSTERAIKEYTSFGNVINYFEEISTNLADLSLNLAGFINSKKVIGI